MEKKAVTKKVSKKAPARVSVPVRSQFAHVLLRPRVTEKASALSSQHIYVFEILKSATKKDVMHAVSAFYGVTPVKVRVVNTPSKQVFVRGKWGVKKNPKKAYVHLKRGDTITIS